LLIKKRRGDSVSILAHSVYNNIHNKDTQDLIKKDLAKVGGVYSFVHNESKNQYIGSSMDLARRIFEHISNQHSNLHLQRAISKYYLINFSLYILELLPINEDLTSEELGVMLIKMEQKYLDYFKASFLYNINPNAGKTRSGAKHSEASKGLMSRIRTGVSNPRLYTKEQLEEMSARFKGSNNPMFGKPVTESNKKLISDLFSRSVYLYDANTLTLIDCFSKHKDLIAYLGISSKTLVKYKDSGLVFRGKYILSSIKLDPNNV